MKKSLLALIAVIAAIAGYAQSFEYEGITYTVLSESDKTCVLTDGSSASGDVAIPATVPYNGDHYAVTTIGYRAFSNCESLISINIPKGVVTIGGWAFYGCSSLIEINVSENNQYYSSIGGVLFTKDKKTLLCCPGGKEGVYAVPEGVTSIGDQAFYNCTSLTEVYISESVTTIGDYAFFYCISLTTIELPIGLTTIGEYAFPHCWSLTSINIPDGVAKIGDWAFAKCRSLTTIDLPESLTIIGDGAFDSCISLTTINIPKGVTTIGNCTFRDCWSLTTITLPEGVTSIGDEAFMYCGWLTSINIPEGVASIGERAFEFCWSLPEITIPEGVTTIGYSAFRECELLIFVNSYSTNPPVCGNDYVFEGLPSNATLHVPVGSKNSYAVAVGWSVFANIIDDLVVENGIREIEADRVVNKDEAEIYNLQGRRMNVSGIDDLPTGIYIVGGRKVLVK